MGSCATWAFFCCGLSSTSISRHLLSCSYHTNCLAPSWLYTMFIVLIVCSSESHGSSFHRHGRRKKKRNEIFFCEGLWSWNFYTRSSSVFDVFCWSPFWKLATIDRVRCCRRSTKLYLKLTNSGNRQNSKLCVSKNDRNSRNTIALRLVRLKIDSAFITTKE